jgi:regulatory protein
VRRKAGRVDQGSLQRFFIFASMPYSKQLTREEALQKLRQYCGYQERCHAEIREKLYDLKVSKAFHDDILATLIQEDYLNEERFAIAFAGGKFRIKHWGKVKIRYELKQRQISEYCIRKGLEQIEQEEYKITIHNLARKKFQSLKNEDAFPMRIKTQEYLVGKGFETGLARAIVEEL